MGMLGFGFVVSVAIGRGEPVRVPTWSSESHWRWSSPPRRARLQWEERDGEEEDASKGLQTWKTPSMQVRKEKED